MITKKTEADEAIEFLQLELEEKGNEPGKFYEKADHIISKISAIKRMYTQKQKEVEAAIEAAIAPVPPNAPVDTLIKANEDRKTREYQQAIRSNSIDRLVRQVEQGKTKDWHISIWDAYQDMHATILGNTLAL